MTSSVTNGAHRLDRGWFCRTVVGFAVLAVVLASPFALAGYQWEVVQPSDRNIVMGTSLEYDRSGNPTIAYGDRTAGELRLATKTGSGWNIETADARIPAALDHAIDTNGNILICYKASSPPVGYTLLAAQRIGGAWSVSTVAKNVSASAVSCAYDASHVATVVYHYGDRLFLVKQSGSRWSSETVAQGVMGTEPSLAFDAAGKPAIAFNDNQLGKTGLAHVKLARKSGSRWSIETARSGPDYTVRFTSLVFHPTSGEPMISYFLSRTSTPVETHVALKSGGLWTTEFVAVGYSSTLRIDSAANLHIALCDDSPTDNAVFVASRKPLVWSMELVESKPEGYSFSIPSTALDAAGNPALSYGYAAAYEAYRDLRFASWVDAP